MTELLEKDQKKISLLAEVACDYYERKLSQNEIADRLCLSRTRVSRLLKEAEENGIVTISINYHFERHFELEERFKDLFPNATVIVLNNRNRDLNMIQNDVAKLAASYIIGLLKKDMVIGTSWGSTLGETVKQMKPSDIPVQVVQLMGAVPCQTPLHTPQGIVSHLSRIWGDQGSFLNLPLFIKDDYVRKTMCEDINNQRILNLGLFSDIILTGISDISTIGQHSLWLSYLTRDLFNEALDKGAVGAILGRFFDQKGNEVDCEWNHCCVGIPFRHMKSVPNVVVIASGKKKKNSIYTALQNNLVNTLITDGTTASSILGLIP